MSGIESHGQSNLLETYLAPLYWRAMESQRPDALIRDEKAVALVTQSGLDFSQVRQIRMPALLNVMRNLFTREFDRYARDFLGRHPDAVVVHIGCGLDSRFERVATRNSGVKWYDLDLPDVIALRRRYLGDERGTLSFAGLLGARGCLAGNGEVYSVRAPSCS